MKPKDLSLFEIFCGYHSDFQGRLDAFSTPVKNRLLRNLKNSNDKNNFRSIVAEVSFGELFQKLGFEIEYEKKYSIAQSGKEYRPDWTIHVGNSIAICDVYRLGKSSRDQQRNDFENQLMEELEELPFPYYLKIRFLKDYFDTSGIDIGSIITNISEWMSASAKNVGDKIQISPLFEFEVVKIEADIETVCCLGDTNIIDIKPEKVKQVQNLKPNEITKKLNRYNEIIISYGLSYFLCVYIDFTSGFKHRDFVEYFLGRGAEFADYGTYVGNLEQFRHLGKQWTELGEFYNNPQLSGIITLDNHEFQLLLNPLKKQVIYQEDLSVLKEILLHHSDLIKVPTNFQE